MKSILAILVLAVLSLSTLSAMAPYVYAESYYKGQMAPPCSDDTSIQNDYLQIAVRDPPSSDAAKFTLGNTGGDPANPNDDNRILLYGHPYPWSSFTTVRIDGSNYIYGSSVGTFTQNPTSYLTYIKTVWVTHNVQVSQVLALTLNPSTNRVDTMEIRYMLENLDLTNSHNVGLRILLDTMLGSNDGAPFQVPGTGAVTTEREYVGSAIPDYWQSFDDLNNPTVVSQGTLRGGDATIPDRVIFASWPDFYSTTWDYAVTPGKIFGSTYYPDSSVGLYWNPITLGAGQRIEYVTYYGLSGYSQSMLPPLTLSVSGPLSLSIVGGAYSPNPFTVTAYVQDVSTGIINNVAITINLPTGLSLVGSPATQTIPSLNPNEVRSVSWSLRAADQASDTLLSYTVSATATGVSQRTVTRSVLIPALSLTYDTTFRSNPNGYQFNNPTLPTLSWDLFRGTFGADEVEINGQARPRATNYYNNNFRTFASGGSCFGMSSSSLVLYQNSHSAWDLGSDRNRLLDNIGEWFLDINLNGQHDDWEPFWDSNGNGIWDSVRTWGVFPSFIQTPTDWVETYQGRWSDAAIQANRQSNPTPNDAYNKLKQRMASGSWTQNPVVLVFWWRNAAGGTVGHAVVPYRIEESADHQQANVRIYDNNFPGQERTFIFNLATNTARDPDYNGGNDLPGGVGTPPVEVIDLSAIQMEPQMADYDTITPSAHLLYTDTAGNHLGYVNGQFESEINGAYLLQVPADGEIIQPESYFVGNLDLRRELFGTEFGTATVSIMRPNTLVIVDALVTPTSHDEIHISSDGLTVQFISYSGTSSVSIMLDVETSDFARLVQVYGFGVEAQSSVEISFSSDLNTVTLTNNGVTKACNIHFEQIGSGAATYDSVAPVILNENSAQNMQFMDDEPPSLVVENPPAGWALQDGVIFIASASDASGIHSLNFSIREANGDQGISVGFEDIPATYNAMTGKWEWFFNTLQLPDGFYIVLVSAQDNLGNTASITVPYSIRNWAVLELLPATPNNKAGRTMPVKFALRVAASVDPNQPFVYNEELTIKIYATDNPSNILQTSTFGDTARDYRINTTSEHYITNFQTLKTPKTYTVEIWRKNMLIGSFNFKTVK
jgi:hypothetical protein